MDYSTIIIVHILYYTDKLKNYFIIILYTHTHTHTHTIKTCEVAIMKKAPIFLIAVNSCAFQVHFYSGGCSKVYGYDPTFPVIYYQLTQTQLTDLN